MSRDSAWAEIVATTTEQWLPGQLDLTMKKSPVYDAIMRKGGVKKSVDGGTELRWVIKIKEHEVHTGPAATDFQPLDDHRQAWIDWREYHVSDYVAELDKLMNSGRPALVNRYANRMEEMVSSMQNRMAKDFYVNGGTYTDRLGGIETLFGASSTTSAAYRIIEPDGTYGGQVTDLGSFGGTWSANMTTKPNANLAKDWPSGEGDAEYCCWSPKLINYTSTGWVDATYYTWTDTCERVLRQGLLWCTLDVGDEGRPDMIVLNELMFYELQNKQDARKQIQVTANAQSLDLGFREMNFEGIRCVTEANVPANTGYLLNTKHITFNYLGDQLFRRDGPEFDMRSRGFIFLIRTYPQLRFDSPRYFAKLKNYA